MDQVGDLELAWSQGYSGSPALFIDKETICYKCGSCIKFVSDDGSNPQYFPSAGDGVGVLAVHQINKLFAFTEACLEPRIFVYSYPLLEPVAEMMEGAQLEFSHLAFSSSLYLLSVSSLPEFQLIVWNYELGEKLCTADLDCVIPTSVSFNPTNWRQVCVTTSTAIDVWTCELADDKSNITKQRVTVPTVSMTTSSIEEKERDEMMPTRASTRMSKLTVQLPRAAVAGLVGEMAERFAETEDAAPRVKPVSHCWTAGGAVYIGCEQGQLLSVDSETLKVSMLYNPTPGLSMSDAYLSREDTIKLGGDGGTRAPSELSMKSSKSTTFPTVGEGAFNTLVLNRQYLFAGGADGSLRVLEPQAGHAGGMKITESIPLGAAITSLAFNATYRNIVIGSSQGTLHLYSPDDPEPREVIDSHYGNFVGISCLMPGHTYCVTVREDGEVQTWKLDSGELVSTLPIGIQATSIQCSPLSRLVAVGSAAGHIYLLDFNNADNPRIIDRLKLHSGPVRQISFDRFGRFMVTGSDDNAVIVTHATVANKFAPIGFVSVPGAVVAISTYTDDKNQTTQIVATCNDGKEETIREGANRMVTFTLTADQVKEPPLAGLKCDFRESSVQKLTFNFTNAAFGAALIERNVMACLNGKTKKIESMIIPTEAPKKEYSKDSYLVAREACSGHDLAGGMAELSFHRKWLATCSPDGYLHVRQLGAMDRPAKIFPHSYTTGGVSLLNMTPNCQRVITTGYDGILSCYKWRGESEDDFSAGGSSRERAAKDAIMNHNLDVKFETETENGALQALQEWSPQPLFSRPQTGVEEESESQDAMEKAIENDEIYHTPTPTAGADATWLELQAIQAVKEEDRAYADKKQELRGQIRDMRRKIQAMMKENEEVPDIEKLGRHEFDLDIDEQVRLQKEGEAEVQRIREQIEYDNLAKQYLRELIKMNCWDEMVVKGRSIVAFNTPLEVSNYPLRARQEKDLALLERVTSQRKVEMQELEIRRELLEVHPKTPNAPAEDELEDDTEKDGTEQPSTTGSLGAQYGGGNELFYSQFELHSREQKMNQIVLLQDAIHRIKVQFNKDFDDVMVKKDQEIGKIKDKNKRIRKIIEDLDLLEDVTDPEFKLLERPEQLLTVEDEEVKVEKFLTAEQQKKLDLEKKAEEERLAREKGDNARERALDMMMGGVLEVKKEDELKKDVPVPAFYNSKPQEEWSEDEQKLAKEYEKKVKDLNEEREKYKKQLETELKKLQGFIQEGSQSFDELLNNLFAKKIKTEMVIYQEELKIVRLKYSILVEEEMETRERELQRLLDHKRQLKVLTVQALNESRKNVEAFTDIYDLQIAEDKVLDKAFKREFNDVSAVMVDQLYKLFRKRPRAPRLKEDTQLGQTPTSKAPNPFIDRPSSAKQNATAKAHMEAALAEMDKEANMPEGLENHVWERLCHTRRAKVEKEQLIKQKALVLAEMNAFVQRRSLEDDKISAEINDLMEEINLLKEDRLRYQCNLEVQLMLKQGQVEVDAGSFVHNFKTSILVHRSVVEDLNSKIRSLGESKIASMVESKDFRKGIIHQEWEHRKMLMEMEDLKNKHRDIQMLKVTREIQAFLYEDDHDAKKAQEISTLEQTIISQKQHHEGNVAEKRKQSRELGKTIREKEETNKQLDRVLEELNVSVNERRHIEEVNADTKQADVFAERRYQDIVQRRKLVDLAKAQAQEVAVLRAEVERLRMRTFPALVQVDR